MKRTLVSTAITLGGLLGRIAYYLPIREKQVAQRQLARFLPEAPPATSRRLFDHLGRSLIEGVLCRSVLEVASVTCDGWDAVERARAEGRGLVTLTGHLGSWDLFSGYANYRGMPLHAIGREVRGAISQRLVQRLRDQSGVTMLWRTGLSGGREIARLLTSGATIAALIDQDTTVRSEWVPFLGHPAKTPATLVEIALRTRASIISAFLVRTGPLSYRVDIRAIDGRKSVQAILREYHVHLESLIRKYPEQWVWIHKRWRSPVEAAPLSSTEYLAWLTQREGGGEIQSEAVSVSHEGSIPSAVSPIRASSRLAE